MKKLSGSVFLSISLVVFVFVFDDNFFLNCLVKKNFFFYLNEDHVYSWFEKLRKNTPNLFSFGVLQFLAIRGLQLNHYKKNKIVCICEPVG